MSSASADVSPMQPPTLPRKTSRRPGRLSSVPAFIIASGVAPETPSSVQVVIGTGQLVSIIARPASAGLTMLQPKPPKNCLTTMIAKRLPKTAIQKGMVGGRL